MVCCQIIVVIFPQLYLSLEIKLLSFPWILKFKQPDWSKKCIDFNRDISKNAANISKKYFLKLMNNSVYGGTIENLRNGINVRLIINAKDYRKYVSSRHEKSPQIRGFLRFLFQLRMNFLFVLNCPIRVFMQQKLAGWWEGGRVVRV